MSESAGNNRKRYIYHPKDISKLPCLIHGPRHSSDECKVLGEFGTMYDKCRPTKERMQEPSDNK